MDIMKVYHYPACSTCKKALKYLQVQGIPFSAVDIVQTPPSSAELQAVLESIKARGGTLKNMFNTSGVMYREMNLSNKLPSLSEPQALKLLAENGKLIKRPFVVSKQWKAVGFQEDVWKKALSKNVS